MPKMQIVTDEMINRAGTIGENTSRILESQNQITRIFQNMGRNFSGRIPTLMTQTMLAMDKDYKSMNGILTGYKDFLEESAHNYEWNEAELAKWAESLGDKSVNPSGNNSNAGISNSGTSSSSSSTSSTETNSSSSIGAEANNFGTAPAGGWDTSNGWNSIGSTFPNDPPDTSSEYYRKNNPEGIQRASGFSGNNGCLDCCFYARSRAMERHGWDSYKYDISNPTDDPEAIKNGDCVAWFHHGANGTRTHAVYVEYYDQATDTVFFTDANMGNPANDGKLQSMSFSDFQTFGNKQGWRFANAECS